MKKGMVLFFCIMMGAKLTGSTLTKEQLNQKLIQAVKNKDIKNVVRLLDAGADPNCSFLKNHTPLYIASRMGKKKIIKLLLEYRANINARTTDGETPLHIASCYADNLEVVKLLVKHKANIYIQNNNGQTAQMLAHALGNTQVYTYLKKLNEPVLNI